MTPAKALIVDKDHDFQRIAPAALDDLGFESIHVVSDGNDAIATVSAKPEAFDLILCGLQVSDMDGIMVIRELGKLGYKGQVIIVSNQDAILRESVFQMGKLANLNMKGTLSKALFADGIRHLIECESQTTVGTCHAIERHQLLHALDAKQLVPFFQPKIDLRTNRVSGFEVLCRHIGEDGKVSAPMPYIKSAMACSLIGSLTKLMIEQVIDKAAGWDRYIGEFNLAINMSPACILNPNLPDRFTNKFKSAGFDPRMITIEVTEDRLIEDRAVILEVLARLRLAGFNLSLDDFGVGAASIHQLLRFPFHEVKVDRQFVKNAVADEFSRLTIETAVKLSSLRGMSVVAEGVEDESMLDVVRHLGAATAQGFFYSPAIHADHVLDWVSEHNRAWSLAA